MILRLLALAGVALFFVGVGAFVFTIFQTLKELDGD